ncbi:hypothetical protein PBI_COUNT_47 [Microbacterium phage Count]|nr:hypothetical protein PBI_COUNT_47 [Microbacterium phage Count]
MTQDYNGYSPEMSEEIQYAVKQIENEGYVSVENVSVEVEKELTTMGYIRQPVDTELVIAPEPSRPDGQFQRDLASLLNSYSAESPSGTPDFILADFMNNILREFNEAIGRRAEWRGEEVEFRPRPEDPEGKKPTRAEEVANNILERQSEARDHLVDMLMKDPGALATLGDDWEVNMGQISFHTDSESMRTLDEYRIQVVQEVRFRARKPEDEIPVEALKQHGHIEQVFQTLEDAREMEDRLRRLLTQYGAVARADFLTLNGESGTYEDAIWGWRDLSDLRIVKRGTTWVMKFPLEIRLHTAQ